MWEFDYYIKKFDDVSTVGLVICGQREITQI